MNEKQNKITFKVKTVKTYSQKHTKPKHFANRKASFKFTEITQL